LESEEEEKEGPGRRENEMEKGMAKF